MRKKKKGKKSRSARRTKKSLAKKAKAARGFVATELSRADATRAEQEECSWNHCAAQP